jgi:hypothetical protein
MSDQAWSPNGDSWPSPRQIRKSCEAHLADLAREHAEMPADYVETTTARFFPVVPERSPELPKVKAAANVVYKLRNAHFDSVKMRVVAISLAPVRGLAAVRLLNAA